jgi:hypothetical protein
MKTPLGTQPPSVSPPCSCMTAATHVHIHTASLIVIVCSQSLCYGTWVATTTITTAATPGTARCSKRGQGNVGHDGGGAQIADCAASGCPGRRAAPHLRWTGPQGPENAQGPRLQGRQCYPHGAVDKDILSECVAISCTAVTATHTHGRTEPLWHASDARDATRGWDGSDAARAPA